MNASPTPLASPHILYVDDEEKALHYFRQMFEDDYVIHTATNAADGYSILEKHGTQIGVLLTDQRMPGENGVEFMERARKLHPNLVSILVTAFTDYQTAVKAVNEGRAFRYLHKPLDPEQLAAVLSQGVLHYQSLQEREDLLSQNAENIRSTLMADRVAGMGILAEGLNHHLRNALTVVRAFIDLAPMKLMEEIGGRPPYDVNFWVETQHQAQSQIDRIQSLLNHLAYASQSGRLVRKDSIVMETLLGEMFNLYLSHFQERHIRVDIDVAPDLPAVLVHGERFRQLWQLLMIEEITHLRPGDRVHVSVHTEKDNTGLEQLVMILRDSGSWNGDDRAANLFDPFFTRSRKPDDFGVNMMACYVTLHLHGGSIQAQRLDPQGLELTMRLPLDPAQSIPVTEDFFLRAAKHQESWKNREEMAA